MGRKNLWIVMVLVMFLLVACNTGSEDPGEENTETVGIGEQQEDYSKEPEDDEQEEKDPEDWEDGGEPEEEKDDADVREESEKEDSGEDEGEEEEEELNLKEFYGMWEMEEDEDPFDVMVMEISEAEAERAKDQEEDFEYMRFGYQYSEFFPMEKVTEVEKSASGTVYAITTVVVEEAEEDVHGMGLESVGKETRYTLERLDDDNLLLTYESQGNVIEMKFFRL